MDFELNEEQKALSEMTRDVLAKNYDASKRNEVVATDQGWSSDVWKQFAELGLLGLSFSEEDGGMDAGPVETMAVMTELGRRLAPEPLLDAVLTPGGLIADVGSDVQRKRLLPAVSEGGMLLAFAHGEPGGRWPTVILGTKAEQNGDAWTLTGVKNPVPHGDVANVLVVSAALPSGKPGLFLVEAAASGVTRKGYATFDGLRGAQIEFSGAAAELLGHHSDVGEIDASEAIQAAEIRAQAALCAEAVGAMEEALRLTTEYLKSRKQFGVPIAKFQALTHRASDMYILLELARSMSLYATMSLADGTVDPIAASRAKLQIGRSSRLIGQEAIQLHGGIGITDEYPVGHYVSRLVAIEHTLGGVDDHLRILSA